MTRLTERYQLPGHGCRVPCEFSMNMKSNPSKSLISRLNRLKVELEILTNDESKNAFLKNLDELIKILTDLRRKLSDPALSEKAFKVLPHFEQVVGFLESAKNDEALKVLLLPYPNKSERPKVEIPANLTNDQIRALLEKDLSRDELKAIARQRAISTDKSNSEEIKRDILRNLERQEGYGRLSGS